MFKQANKMHDTQRQAYYELKQFLMKPQEGCKIAILAGIRRIGKTGVLTDLAASLPNTVYVNFSRNRDIKAERKKCLEFSKLGNGILLIDEITQYPNYEAFVENVEKFIYTKGQNIRVVFTGSSSLHLLALKSGLLGAGRAKLFRMSFLSFAEYLVFTGRKTSYKFIDAFDITADDFKNYLQLKGLSADGLKISFDKEYMVDLYHDILVSNQSSRNPGLFADLKADDLLCVLDLVAYSLVNITSWGVFKNPDGERELGALNVEANDLNGLRIFMSSQQIRNVMQPQNIARALYYLLVANLAYVDAEYYNSNKVSASELAHKLFDIKTAFELEQVFKKNNICLVNPLWYMRLATEVLEKYKCTASQLPDTSVIGGVLENYIKGSYCRWLNYQYEYDIYKIGSAWEAGIAEERSKSQEVDLCDTNMRLLCEITVSNKDSTHLTRHFSDIEYIRILSTRDVERSVSENSNTHKVPYPKLCAMVDTGEIFMLKRTVYTEKTKANNVSKMV